MKIKYDINEYIQALKNSHRMGSQVVFHHILPKQHARILESEKPFHDTIKKILTSSGIEGLYEHQVRSIDLIRSKKHVVIATPTASGKTLIYNLPVFEEIFNHPASTALYLFPLKALAQDQHRTIINMASHLTGAGISAEIYDGDTTAYKRRRIRERPPHIILTNPEMLHLSFLGYHQKWFNFLKNLKFVVLDEVHTYRGLMGSHMAQVFRRFQRICSFYGSDPVYIFSSATVANPADLVEQLTGRNVHTITQSGAPQGRKHLVFVEAPSGAAQTTILLLKAALHRGLRTIVYTQSRKLAELIAIWVKDRSGKYQNLIRAYRAGFLPEERRDIESKLASGEILAVVSTSALELGIDIGDLDLCILVGYPGTIISTWQRGGRVGRSGQDSALLLVAGEDALDQYFLRHPDDFLKRDPEAAVVNPSNTNILKKHLLCAAAELPLKLNEPILLNQATEKAIYELEQKGRLLKSADGKEYYSHLKAPHRHVNLRGIGHQYRIILEKTGENKGEIDAFRAFRETHSGAIYIHNGQTYTVVHLDINTRTAAIAEAHVKYYTRVRAEKSTEIIEISAQKMIMGTSVYAGRLRITDHVTSYDKWLIHGHKWLENIPLDLPAQVYETQGMWFIIPPEIQRRVERQFLHFMGGIHAIEHAAIGIFPLMVLTDRNDLGGISTVLHPQLKSAAVFIYDAIPGGAGLTHRAFEQVQNLLQLTYKTIRDCPCQIGCPSCVHSPKCGSGNRPIDKASALYILNSILSGLNHPSEEVKVSDIIKPVGNGSKTSGFVPEKNRHIGVFDLETQLSHEQVGGWHRADLMRISCGVLYDSKTDQFYEFLEDQVHDLIDHLKQVDLIVGFNIRRFDYQVLRGYSDFNFDTLECVDILDHVYQRLGYRLSLDHLAAHTLGTKKNGNGLLALKWWKQGRIREIVDYCTMDVKITRDLFIFGAEHGYLLFSNKSGKIVRLPVNF